MAARMLTGWIAWLALFVSACLGVEEHAKPGRVELRVALEPSSADFVTDDGWRVRIDELFVSMGNVRLDRGSYDGSCGAYSETSYLRVVDLLEGPSRLATLYALDDCTLHLQLMGPSDLEIVTDVRDDVVRELRASGSDDYVSEQSVALRIAGTAERAGERYRFAWSFRQAFDLESCALLAFDPARPSTAEVGVRASAFFRGLASDEPAFGPFALADANDDGAITLAELADTELGERLYFDWVPGAFQLGDQPPCFAGRVLED